MITYKHWMKVSCLRCNHSPLEIQAFIWMDNGTEKSVPVLVCPSRGGCGAFFDIDEYDLVDEELRR